MSGPPPIPLREIEIELILSSAAPQLLGAVWNWFLYGVLVVQFYVYSYNFPRDIKYIKLLVYSIFFLETVQTVLSGANLYYWFAASFGNFHNLLSPFASSFDVPILGSVVAISVQLFFVYRILVLSEKRSRWLCFIILLLSIIGASGAFASSISTYMGNGQVKKISIDVFEVTWIAANTLSDSLIASAMLYHLRRVCTRDGNLSNHIFVRIVRLTVETNLVTTSVGILSLLMIGLFQHRNFYLCPTYVLGKLYSNTLLVSLNNRIWIRDTHESRGKVFDCRVPVARVPGSACSEATGDTIVLEAEKPQEDLRKQPVAEA
ncbi:hypothetical protein BJV77DRAFT_1153101 [Russula vinacea]|nr:hypothetical protein BJV77DRAFT_1153101 [Russula vinacea]